MSLKVLQFPIQGSLRSARLQGIPETWTGPFGSRDMGILSSLLDEDSDSNRASRINWGAFSGLALSLAISVGFWAGVGLLIEHFLH